MGATQSTAYADGCPVDHKNMSPEQIAAFLSHRTPSLPDGPDERVENSEKPSPSPSTSASTSTTTSADSRSNQYSLNSDRSSSGCPVDHKNMTPDQIDAYMSRHKTADAAFSDSATAKSPPSVPSPASRASSPGPSSKSATVGGSEMYDVYAQRLDPSNLMPSTPNQLPSPGQRGPLSTDRAVSSIPKSGDNESAWVYPSPQMFYNALKRKGKSVGVEESDIPTVVAVHNRMNEATWAEIRQWEARFHCNQCQNPKLKRFRGRPHDLSPAARFRMWFRGYPRPFDRHDWIVDRCGQEDARYIIDYYYTDNGPDPIEIHVRPAVDSVSAAYDRLRFGLLSVRHFVGLTVPPAPQMDASTVNTQSSNHDPERLSTFKGESIDSGEFAFLTELTPSKIRGIADDVQAHCAPIHKAYADAVANATDEHDTKADQAHMTLNYCMARHICKLQANDFMKALESGKDPSDAYGNMTACLDRFQIMARRTLMDAAGITQSGPEFPAGVVPSTAQRSDETSVPLQS